MVGGIVSCDDCDECVNVSNIIYIDIVSYGAHKSCLNCYEKYFTTPNAHLDETMCVEVLDDAPEEESIIFFCAYKKDSSFNYRESDFIATSPSASDARGWLTDPKCWLDLKYASGNTLVVGFYEGWVDKPETFYAYYPEDDMLPIFEAAELYDKYHYYLHGYSQLESRALNNPVPSYVWKREHMDRLDCKIEDLQNKRNKIEKL